MEEMDERELIRKALGLIGSIKTAKKSETSAANINRVNDERRAKGFPPETIAKMKAKQAARRRREREELGLPPLEAAAEKRAPGRPRSAPAPEPEAPKRPRGRPKKTPEDAQGSIFDDGVK